MMPPPITDPHTIRLWIATKLGNQGHIVSDSLWWRDIRTAHTPSLDDRLHPFADPNDTDGEIGPDWTIKSRYWDGDGHCNIELTDPIVDPTDELRDRLARSPSGWLRERSWNTTRDRPLDDLLVVAGWHPWGDA